MKNWWQNLEQRERWILTAGGVVVMLAILYLLVWEPVSKGVTNLQRDVQGRRGTLQWMQTASGEVATLNATARPRGRGLGGRSLLSVVDQSARRSQLGPALKRVEPEGKNKVRVWLENVPFDSVVSWIGRMDNRYGVVVDSIRVERQKEAGKVNARVTLSGPK